MLVKLGAMVMEEQTPPFVISLYTRESLTQMMMYKKGSDVMNKNIRGALLECNPLSERTTTARIQTKVRKISTVQCYAPTEDAQLAEKEAFSAFCIKTLLSKSEVA